MFDWLKDRRRIRRIGQWFGWLAFVLVLLTLLTGYGIAQFRVVGPLTLGFFSKAFSQHWHESAGVLVVVFLIPHVGIALWWRFKGAQGREGAQSREGEASESKS